jgi:hypothetical protein
MDSRNVLRGIKLVCRDSNNNFSIFLFKRRDFVINAVLLISSILNICFILYGSKILLLYPHSTREGGILYYLCLSFHPSKIFFIAFISATIDGRNLIFGHKFHIGMPYCGKRFWTRQNPTSCLPT